MATTKYNFACLLERWGWSQKYDDVPKLVRLMGETDTDWLATKLSGGPVEKYDKAIWRRAKYDEMKQTL